MHYSDMTEEELNRAAAQHGRVNNEGGEGYNPYDDELDRRMAAVQKKARADVISEWTPEVTEERKARWNSALKENMPAGKLTASDMMTLIEKTEAIVGFKYRTLKEAIRNHK